MPAENNTKGNPLKQSDPTSILFFSTQRGDIITHSEGLSPEQYKTLSEAFKKVGVGTSFKLLLSNYKTANGNSKYKFCIQTAEETKQQQSRRSQAAATPTASDDI